MTIPLRGLTLAAPGLTSAIASILVAASPAGAKEPAPCGATSYAPVAGTEAFADTVTRMTAEKDAIIARHAALLEQRYDLADRGVQGANTAGGKAVQAGTRVKLANGGTWDQLGQLSPADIKSRDLWPAGFYPLPHPNHPEGGMLFPQIHIDELKRSTHRDLTRFDLDFVKPDHFLPESPAPNFLTTRPDLGDVSQGQLVTTDNYLDLFNGILNPKQLEGLRLLVTPFPQQQYNATHDRRHVLRLPRARTHERCDAPRG